MIVVGLVVAVAVLAVAVGALTRRLRRIDARVNALTGDGRSDASDPISDRHLDKVDAVARGIRDLDARMALLEAAQRGSMQRVGLVRYNPFEETGGNQSFALAMLDADGDGWLLSSLHARAGTRVYAKAVSAGRSDVALSDEETAALRQALA
ncbi:MAG TPA: DUF4446 family protein [Candidatus Limnocylindrales bacterium]